MTHRRGHANADPGHLHRGRDARAGAVFHQHRSAGLRADQSAGNRQGRAVRALLAVGQVAAAAVPRRVPRTRSVPSTPPAPASRRSALARADKLYARVLNEYGDDSVAQLGGAHVACEGVSNVLTKVLEWGRLMAYLEQSTRYVPYTDRPNGRWKYHVPAEVERSPLAAEFTQTLDAAFETYAGGFRRMEAHFRAQYPKSPEDSDARLPVGDPRQGARHAARPAAGGDDVERRAVRHRPGVRSAAAAHVRAPARRGARARRADARRAPPGDPGVSRARRSAGSRRPLDRVLRRHAARRSKRPRGAIVDAVAAEPRPTRSRSPSSIPTARSRSSRRRSTPCRGLPDDQLLDGRPPPDAPTSAPRCCAPTSATARTAATSRAARSSARSTGSTSSPTTAPSAICSAIACSRSSGSRSAPITATPSRRRSRKPGALADWRAVMERSAALDAALAAHGLDEVAPYAVVDGVSRAVLHGHERARGDARHRAADRAAGPPVLPARLPADAPRDRRRRRPPRHRRRDAVRRSLRRSSSNGCSRSGRSRTKRRATASR